MKKAKVHFQMSLWQRIKAASLMWWAIVVTGELSVIDDEGVNRNEDIGGKANK